MRRVKSILILIILIVFNAEKLNTDDFVNKYNPDLISLKSF